MWIMMLAPSFSLVSTSIRCGIFTNYAQIEKSAVQLKLLMFSSAKAPERFNGFGDDSRELKCESDNLLLIVDAG